MAFAPPRKQKANRNGANRPSTNHTSCTSTGDASIDAHERTVPKTHRGARIIASRYLQPRQAASDCHATHESERKALRIAAEERARRKEIEEAWHYKLMRIEILQRHYTYWKGKECLRGFRQSASNELDRRQESLLDDFWEYAEKRQRHCDAVNAQELAKLERKDARLLEDCEKDIEAIRSILDKQISILDSCLDGANNSIGAVWLDAQTELRHACEMLLLLLEPLKQKFTSTKNRGVVTLTLLDIQGQALEYHEQTILTESLADYIWQIHGQAAE